MRAAAAVGLIALSATPHLGDPLPPSRLRLRAPGGSEWVTWWRSDTAPVDWSSAPSRALFASALRWRVQQPGVELTEVVLAGEGEAIRTAVVALRLDTSRVRLSLVAAFDRNGAPAWRAGDAPSEAIAAVNAGHFVDRSPWGWVVLDERQRFPPGNGPLVTTIAMDSNGTVHFMHAAGRPETARWAFQSYPTLLAGRRVPPPLRTGGGALNVSHRDGRVAIGQLDDGRIVIAMTRFRALGEALGFVPFGLTTPEMAAVMGALGARDAVMLDGGISAQLLVSDAGGRRRVWPGIRAVPVGLVVKGVTARSAP